MKKNNLKIVIVGGGSTYTPGIVRALLNHRDEFHFSELVLYDIDQERLDDMHLIIDYMLQQDGLQDEVTLVSSLDMEESFTNSDFLFTQIRTGGFKMREFDEKIPLKYGQVGQETCGLGGFSYGLRTIGPILEIVEGVQKYAPEAWILNYTNPETIVSEAVRRKFPDVKMVNACDMTISIEETIAVNFGYDRKNWISTYYGLNHFGWYTSIYDTELERDVMPEIIEKIANDGLQVADFNAGDSSWQKTWDNMQKIVQQFPEYLPNNYLEYYFFPDLIAEQSNPNYTRANMIMEGRYKNTVEMADKIRQQADGEILNFNFGEHGEYIIDIALSILNDKKDRFMLIVENNGAIPNLRHDAMVEVPTYVTGRGLEPIALGEDINDFHKGLMEVQNASEKLLVDAYFENSYQKALMAFTINQTIPNARVAKQILDDFIEANGDYWPELR